MMIEILGDFDRNKLYCSGSFTKFMTSFVCLSLLSENYDLETILDDGEFFDKIAKNTLSKNFLKLFQKIIKSQFSLRDICTYYTGLPYTFNLAKSELVDVENGKPFKHHSILDENAFLNRCKNHINPIYTNQCKFHYSEISIIFLGYFIEKVYSIPIEDLYQQYVIAPFNLTKSLFSRVKPDNVACQDLSDIYDYPSIAILDHGYFCYSNGFFTTLNDAKILLENILINPVFQHMVDLKKARAVSPKLLNGLTIEIHTHEDDVIYGYEGLSYSGCNAWSYSTKLQKGYIAFGMNENDTYDLSYQPYDYTEYNPVPPNTADLYLKFIKHYHYQVESRNIPEEFIGNYHRVNINSKTLSTIFLVAKNYIAIRNPDMVKYDVIFVDGYYRIKNKDNTHGTTVEFYTADSGNQYFLFDGTLYKKFK